MKKTIGVMALLALLVPGMAVFGATPVDRFVPEAAQTTPLEADGKPERLTAEELTDKAGAEEDIYRKFGVVETVLASWKAPEEAGRRVEAFFHAFPNELSAFATYAEFRAATDTEEPWGNGGVASARRAFFWHGKYVVVADGYGAGETTAEDLRRVMAGIAALMGEAPPRPPVLAAFEGIVSPASVVSVPGHLLDLADLPPGFVGTAGETTVFVASEPVRSRGVLAALAKEVAAKLEVPWDDPETIAFEDPVMGPIVVAFKGTGLAGAFAPPGTEGLKELLERLCQVPDAGR